MNGPVEVQKPELICPVMSGQVVPVQPGNGKIATPNTVTLAPLMIPCQRAACRFWHGTHERCVVEYLYEIDGLIMVLSDYVPKVVACLDGLINAIHDHALALAPPPPLGVPSPQMRIVAAAEKLIELFEKRFGDES